MCKVSDKSEMVVKSLGGLTWNYPQITLQRPGVIQEDIVHRKSMKILYVGTGFQQIGGGSSIR